MKRTELKRKPVAKKALKPKRCSECPTVFSPWNSTQVVCSGSCGIARKRRLDGQKERAEARKREKLKRAELRARKEALKTKSEWMKEAQAAFNWFIRERDYYEPCICCGQWVDEGWKPGGSWDAGHFRSVGAHPELRFEELNCHKQAKSCNAGEGKYAAKRKTVNEGYKRRLPEKIGQEAFDWLMGPHEPKHYTIEDYKRIKKHYNAKARALKKAREENERFNAA